MNNAKLWLVVKPTVGIPIFLGAVAVGSFSVHLAVLSNTGWVSNFLKGQPLDAVASVETEQGVNTASVIFDEHGVSSGIVEATVVLPDGRKARAIFDAETAALDTVAILKNRVDKQ